MTVILDLDDIQGIVAVGYRDLRAACFLLVGIDNARATRNWLTTLASALTTASATPGVTAVNVALTSRGLERLGLPAEALGMFSSEFLDGMVTPSRSRGLGDIGTSSPSSWDWGGPGADAVDIAILLYATDQPGVDELAEFYASEVATAGMFVRAKLDTSDHGNAEPFGFRDGISMPVVEGMRTNGSETNAVKAGEFVLGYPNEYGLYTSRPLVPTSADPGRHLPADAEGSGRADLGRNGTYLVLRQLEQDVAAFWRFTDTATRRKNGASDSDAALKLAAKIVGRWPSGAPLVLAPDADDPNLAEANDFGYFHEDPFGVRCPLGSHIRRSNPRDSLDPKPGSEASVDVGRRHMILRRGREYGTRLTRESALADAETGSRGLYFICVNANIARQFEFLQRNWINNPKFNGLYNDRDPLVSTQAGSNLTMPGEPTRTRVTNLPSFVTVKGGGYFFLPGVKAVRFLGALTA